MESEKNVQYAVPANVSTRFEIIDGIGMKEILIIFIAFAISFSLYTAIGIPKKEVVTEYEELSDTQKMLAENGELELNENKQLVEKVNYVSGFIRVTVLIFLPASVFMFIRVDSNTGVSLLSSFKAMKYFMSSQKRYLYVHNSANNK
jgi:hypothetical protein